jgi:hypothetical protein
VIDADSDGIPDADDAFPLDAAESVDTDGDGIGNNSDSDDDNDGIADTDDAFPLDTLESADTDGDGIGNNPMKTMITTSCSIQTILTTTIMGSLKSAA